MGENIGFSGRFQDVRPLSDEGSTARVLNAYDTVNHGTVAIKIARTIRDNPLLRREADVMRRLASYPGFVHLIYQDEVDSLIRLVVTREYGSSNLNDRFKLGEWNIKDQNSTLARLILLRSYADRIQAAWSEGILLTDYKPDAYVFDPVENDGVVVIDLNITRDLPADIEIASKVDQRLNGWLSNKTPTRTELGILTELLRMEKGLLILGGKAPGSSEYKMIIARSEQLRQETVTDAALQARRTEIDEAIKLYFDTLKVELQERVNKAKIADFFEFIQSIVCPMFHTEYIVKQYKDFNIFDLFDNIPEEFMNIRGWVVDVLIDAVGNKIEADGILSSFASAITNDYKLLGVSEEYLPEKVRQLFK